MSNRTGELWRKASGWKLPVVSGVALVFALYSVLSREKAPAQEPYAPPPTTPFAQAISGIGLVEPNTESIAIGTELSGVVREVFVKSGQSVEEDAPLFSLDQRRINAQIERLRAQLKVAEVQLEESQTQFDLVRSIRDTRAVSRDEFNRRKYSLERAQSQLKEARAAVKEALTTRGLLTVRAPVAGTVLEVNVRPGEFAPAGILTQPLVRVGNLSPLHIRVDIDQEHIPALSAEAAAKATSRGSSSRSYNLTFVRFEPSVAPKSNVQVVERRIDTRVLEVIYALPSDASGLFVGQEMDVFIEKQPRGDRP